MVFLQTTRWKTAGAPVPESRSPALIFILKQDAFKSSTFALQHYTKALSFIIVYGFCNCLSIKWTFWQSSLWLCLQCMCMLFFSFSLTSGLHVDGCSEENSSYRSRQQNQSPWTVNMELQAKHRPLTQHLTKSFSSIIHWNSKHLSSPLNQGQVSLDIFPTNTVGWGLVFYIKGLSVDQYLWPLSARSQLKWCIFIWTLCLVCFSSIRAFLLPYNDVLVYVWWSFALLAGKGFISKTTVLFNLGGNKRISEQEWIYFIGWQQMAPVGLLRCWC